MIEVVEDLVGSVQDTGTLNTSLDEVNTLVGNLDSVGNLLKEQDVNFYDYTGDLLYSYKRNDFLALTEMPRLIAHDKLVSQGWNWDLGEAKQYVERNGYLDIGEVYDTYNKGVIIGIVTDESTLYQHFSVDLKYDGNDETHIREGYIDWGDGSETEVLTPESPDETYFSVGHTYANIGEYEIIFYVTEGTTYDVNFNTFDEAKYIHVGSAFKPSSSFEENTPFENHIFLEYVTFSNYTIKEIIYGFFRNCNNLKALIFPKGFEHINEGVENCFSLAHLILPNTVISVVLYNNYKINNLCLPTSCEGAFLSLYNNYMNIYFPSHMSSLWLNAENVYINTVKCPSIVTSNFVLNMTNSFTSYLELPETAAVIPASEEDEEPLIPVNLYNTYITKTLHLPSWVTNIGKILYLYDYNLQKIYFTEHTEVPVLESSSALQISTSCHIIVPDALYDEWCSATNWSAFAYRRQIKKASEMS